MFYNTIDFLGQYSPPTPGGGYISMNIQQNNKQKLNINPFILLNAIHKHREEVLKTQDSRSPQEIQRYKNYEYIDEMEKEYGVTLPRPADAPPPKNQTVAETQTEIKSGGHIKSGGGMITTKHRHLPLHTTLQLRVSMNKLLQDSSNNQEIDYTYLDVIEHDYNIKIPRKPGTNIPEDLDSFIESVTPETQTNIKSGGTKKKQRYTRRRSRNN